MKPVLLDTGVIVALRDRSERHHSRCVAVMEELERPLATCEAVIAGAREAILENVEKGIFEVPYQLSRSAAAVRTILHKYRDAPASLADACLIHMADELDTGDILTLDRDFEFYRWRTTHPFRLLIDLG